MSTWILLRGLTRERRHWGPFPAQLSQEFPGARVVPLELPGNGEHNALDSPANIAGMVMFCRSELARSSIAPPHLLLGLSMGGMVATTWAADHPGEVTGCVLINTSLGAFSPLHQRLRPRAWPALLAILAARTAEARELRILGLTSCLAATRPQLIAEWAAIRRSHPVSARNGFCQLLAAARFQAPPRAPVPTLVLAGARDGLVDPRCSREIARRWQCPLAVHPEAGHDLPLDDGAWVVREIRNWLSAIPGK